MIVPMKKVSFVILENDRKKSLTALRKAGVVHLEPLAGVGDDLAALKAQLGRVERLVSLLDGVKLPKGFYPSQSARNNLDAKESALKTDEVLAYFDEKKTLEDEIVKTTREIERFAPWGEVDPADFAFLAEKGIRLAMFEVPNDAYDKIDGELQIIPVNGDGSQKRVLAVCSEEGRPAGMPQEAYMVPLPEKSVAAMNKDITSWIGRINELERKILESKVFVPSIVAFQKALTKDIEFENVYSGMGVEEELAWLTGFVPVPEVEKVKKVAAENHWAAVFTDPEEEDMVPTQLKNSKPVQMLYPLLDFLGTVPGYREFDIGAWFLFFFAIFFAMIFGDAGYGILLTLVGVVLAVKTKLSGKPVALFNQLFILVSVMTVIWGTLNCTWFGIAPDKLPEIFHKLTLPAFDPRTPDASTNVQIFCFILALAQLSVGHFVALLRNIKEKSLKMFADIGSLGILWGMFFVVLNLLISSERFPISNIILGMIGGGFALSFIFSNYEGSIGASILESCKNIISVLLGVINFFSDIVSYIRLWAVGLAGGAIAQTVNQMAGPMLGHFLMFAGILLLVFGHGLNMVLNVLSVIVHGVRLNTLEFTSHVGMSWTGFKYEPFSEK